MAQRAETTVTECSQTNCVWVRFLIDSHTLPGQRHSQPTLTSMGQRCVRGNTGVERTPNKSQHTKLTLEKKILPPLQPGFELATFRLRVRRSNQQAIPRENNNNNKTNKTFLEVSIIVHVTVTEVENYHGKYLGGNGIYTGELHPFSLVDRQSRIWVSHFHWLINSWLPSNFQDTVLLTVNSLAHISLVFFVPHPRDFIHPLPQPLLPLFLLVAVLIDFQCVCWCVFSVSGI